MILRHFDVLEHHTHSFLEYGDLQKQKKLMNFGFSTYNEMRFTQFSDYILMELFYVWKIARLSVKMGSGLFDCSLDMNMRSMLSL